MTNRQLMRFFGDSKETLFDGNKPALPIVGTVRVNSMGPMQWCSRPPLVGGSYIGPNANALQEMT